MHCLIFIKNSGYEKDFEGYPGRMGCEEIRWRLWLLRDNNSIYHPLVVIGKSGIITAPTAFYWKKKPKPIVNMMRP